MFSSSLTYKMNIFWIGWRQKQDALCFFPLTFLKTANFELDWLRNKWADASSVSLSLRNEKHYTYNTWYIYTWTFFWPCQLMSECQNIIKYNPIWIYFRRRQSDVNKSPVCWHRQTILRCAAVGVSTHPDPLDLSSYDTITTVTNICSLLKMFLFF